ncbi:Ger(x)C family spore germination protein [Clostridium sp. JS66]|uniref:Ger(x)C family spore germination protein n=1 Tax=Clostridium sp. JS66 TaxID=3064705 RepID=UPI00298D9BBD|nr:Ger(x)C family spore germination protein [Clostridium sp. JS66]WPC39977.1 Ger(x)C family spore germination protein [Clostridium sp. JS66]
MKKFICIFMSIIISFSATGCKGTKQEVEKLGLVLATGLDLTPENKYKLTVQILNPKKDSSQDMSSKKDGQQVSSDVMIFTSEGDTPYDAVSRLSTEYGSNLFLGHIEYMVIGKKLAESGLELFIDAISRGQQARIDSTLLLAKDKASSILAFHPLDDSIPANSVSKLIKIQSLRGFSPVISRLDFINALSSETTAPIIGVIDIDQDNNEGNTFKLAGTGVFRKDKLIGYFDINETRGMQWIKGKVKDGTIVSPSPYDSKVSFFLLNATSRVKPIVENDSIKIQITIKVQSNILEMSGKLDPMKNPEVMNNLGELQSKAIEKEVNLALNSAQNKLNADIFDFGGLIHREQPKAWKRLEKNWEHIFPNMKVEVNVISNIKGSGTISKSIK